MTDNCGVNYPSSIVDMAEYRVYECTVRQKGN